MKTKRLIHVSILLAVLAAIFGFARFDDDILRKAAIQLTKWANIEPTEKVYLHLDKPYYAIGDDIWFKAYVTIGGKHQLSGLSGSLNVELIDDKDSIKKAIKLPLTAGVAWGDFKLNDSLGEGNYRIRAYTNWMRNAGEDYFYDRTITIGNSISNSVFTSATYKYTNENNQQKVEAAITYTNVDGKPYAAKEVNYVVELGPKQVARGKGITDDKGNITFTFANNSPATLKSGHITTIVKLSPTEKVSKTIPVKAASEKTDVQFFPESGTFLSGIRNKVAFKAVGADGLGVDIHGKIMDNDNQEIAAINPQHLGMGAFLMVPQSGKSYYAQITYPDGSEGKVDLPKVVDIGYLLSVYTIDPTDVIVKITTNEPTLQQNQNTGLNIVAQSGGEIIYTAKTQLLNSAFSARIPRSRFPSGITQFTLFSATGEPLNERIALIQNPDQLNIAVSTEKSSYSPREKTKLTIAAKDKDGKPVVGTFSVAVTDETKVPVDEASESTILSNLLLTSDIKGYVEKPNYYFTNVSDKTRADLDVLMLTQGYRRFAWKKLMSDDFAPLAYKVEKSLDITGHVKTLGGKPVVKGKVSLFSTSGGIFAVDTVTDDQGAFAFKHLIFTDSVKFLVQARTAKDGKNVEIDLDNVPSQLVTTNKNAADVEVNINTTLMPFLQNSKAQYNDFLKYGLVSKTIMLTGVTISDTRAPILKHSDNLNGPGNADQVIKSDQLESCTTLSQCLIGLVHFVNFQNGQAYSTRSRNYAMLIVLDGMRMDSSFSLDDINPNDVASVEVLRTIGNTAIYGLGSAGGVLVITTKRGDDVTNDKSYIPGIITYRPKGYYRARQFYSPQYDDPKTNPRVADLRTTIFWRPNIITDNAGAGTLSYFNADSKGTYKVVIEGIDSDGNIGRQVFRYKIE